MKKLTKTSEYKEKNKFEVQKETVNKGTCHSCELRQLPLFATGVAKEHEMEIFEIATQKIYIT